MQADRAWFITGLFLTTFATLALELLDTRLLSVLTWYHLSFFAVSTAMFGMSAGAVRVYLGGERFRGAAAHAALARYGALFALSVPACHVVNLSVPFDVGASATRIGGVAVSTVALAIPFYLSGIVVAVALTRIPGPPGRIYAVDLLGAAVGSVAVLPLLALGNISSAALACGAAAALGAAAFRRFAGERKPVGMAVLAVLLLALAWLNSTTPSGLRILYSKGNEVDPGRVSSEHWTVHGQVMVMADRDNVRPSYWGPGRGARQFRVDTTPMVIDGAALTVMTRWDGDVGSLDWIQHDVTSMPYHLRPGGKVAVIGVGGGRDLLTALWGRSREVLGLEINAAFLDLLSGSRRDYARLADHPSVRLVHDEARSYLTRTDERFDLIQMSLIDTWAATGAGAFTLSENGLYTIQGWRAFLDALVPGGMLSVSRWASAAHASETSRLLALAVAALLDRGIREPERHIALVSARRVATLVVSTEPLTPLDIERLRRFATTFEFTTLLSPGEKSQTPLFERIAHVRSRRDLDRILADQPYDFSPPTDSRPYFFNILRPGQVWAWERGPEVGVIVEGNLHASYTLGLLWVLSLTLVIAVILLPLARSGVPRMGRGPFAQSLLYFSLIGAGYMLVQIPLMQRFSVYLGHPTYSVAVILFSMILATGAGSLLSDRLSLEAGSTWVRVLPLTIAGGLLVGTRLIQPIIDSTIHFGLFARCSIVVAVVGILVLPLGTCFPVGLRLVQRIADDATPWMWGVNGASGVLASVSAVAMSMWIGISGSLLLAALAYVALSWVAPSLCRAGNRRGTAEG